MGGAQASAPGGPPPAPPMAAEAAAEPTGGMEKEAESDAASFRMAQVGKTPTTHAAPPTQPTSQPKEVATDAAPIHQMLIYTARLTMAVFEVGKSLAAVEALSRDMGGFMARRTDREITIRVPVEKFYDAMKKLEGSGDVLHRDVHVDDVTEQFLDLSLRLKNARQVRERIAQLLNEAKTVKDSLEVEKELERLSTEIERFEGRLKYLRDRARYSTITVAFEPMQTEELRRDRIFHLPFPWLNEMGLGRLMNLH